MSVVQVQTTVERKEQADRLAQFLVRDRLAACVQVLGPLESHYRWEGRVERAGEWLLLIKTTAERLPQLKTRLLQQHPYELPQLIVLPVQDGHAPYLRWVEENTRVPGAG